MSDEARKAAALLGRLGGLAGRGAAKARDPERQREYGRRAWAGMSPEERSEEMRRRAAKRKARRKE